MSNCHGYEGTVGTFLQPSKSALEPYTLSCCAWS